jgi:hypothetical protein
VTPQPRTGRAAARAAATAALLLPLLLVGGCSHYHLGIPLVPGLSLGLGATKDGNFSVGLNTGWGPLGAGVALHDNGAVTGSASAGVGVGVGPVGTGVGVGKSVVLHNPYAAPRAAAPVQPVVVRRVSTGAAPAWNAATPGDPIAP